MEGEKRQKKTLSIKNIGVDKLVLIVIAGIVLVICSLPSSDNKDKEVVDTYICEGESDYDYEERMEGKLTELIQSIEGAGKVKVMITFKSTSEKIVKENSEYVKNNTEESDSEGGNRKVEDVSSSSDTVYTTDESGNNIPYIIKEIRPEIEGVAVVAQGADDSVVKAAIVETVNALCGVAVNKISVSKMQNR